MEKSLSGDFFFLRSVKSSYHLAQVFRPASPSGRLVLHQREDRFAKVDFSLSRQVAKGYSLCVLSVFARKGKNNLNSASLQTCASLDAVFRLRGIVLLVLLPALRLARLCKSKRRSLRKSGFLAKPPSRKGLFFFAPRASLREQQKTASQKWISR